MENGNVMRAVRDEHRLEVLRSFDLLDTGAEAAFDRLTRLASKITETPISLVSLIDADRQFMKSLFGLPEPVASERQIPLSHSFCKHVVADEAALVVEDARRHPVLRDNPAIPDYGVIGYLGMPLTTTEGVTLGSFCVIDTRPRRWTEREIEIIRELALSTMTEIELRAQIAARREAEERMENLTDMIVHDLRTPLSIVGGILELLQSTTGRSEMAHRNREMIEEALASTGRMDSMIEDMLQLRKSETGMLEMNAAEMPLEEFLHTQETIFRTQAELEGQRLVVEKPASLPVVEMDEALIARVLDNLVGNGLKYGPAGGTITLTVETRADTVVMGVHDQGPGIDPAIQASIFEKFFQGRDERGKPTRRGVGIGLAFSKLAIEMHGGRIWVESQPGAGSSFFFSLPL